MGLKKGRAVRVGELATYDACHGLMLSGRIGAWSIDNDSGLWSIDATEGLSRQDATAHVAKIGSALTADQLAGVAATLTAARWKPAGPGRLEAGPVDQGDAVTAAMAVLTGTPAVKATRSVKVQPTTPTEQVATVHHIGPKTATQPEAVTEWLNRLVYAPKRAYASAWADHVLNGAAEPADPGTDWAAKVRTRFERLVAA